MQRSENKAPDRENNGKQGHKIRNKLKKSRVIDT